MMHDLMKYEKFQGTLISWDALFAEAARFATALGPARVVDISHSSSQGRGIVVVWYHDDETEPQAAASMIDLELKVYFKRGTMISWDDLFRGVLAKSSELRPEQVVSFSHSDSKGDGISVLWYWDEAAAE